MRERIRFLGEKLRNFCSIPAEVRADFRQEAVERNHVSLLVICVLIFGMELFNMARVLFLSNSGLGTLNNRIYFTMYCILCASAALYLLAWRWLKKMSLKRRWALQFATVLFLLMWHVGINAYDLFRSPDAGTTVYTTAILALAVFIQLPQAGSALCYGAAYAVFMALTASILGSGDILNLTITTIVALAVSMTNSYRAAVILRQHQALMRMNRDLRLLAQKDPLTGLLNKAAFQDRVEQSIGEAGAENPLTVLIVDMDDFKGINDRHGHPCGDYVLKETALELQTVFSAAAGIGRVGGDEFSVVLTGMGAAQVEAMSRKLIQNVQAIRWHGRDVESSCSVGICRICRSDVSFGELYEKVDGALYWIKGHGKGDCCFCEIA